MGELNALKSVVKKIDSDVYEFRLYPGEIITVLKNTWLLYRVPPEILATAREELGLPPKVTRKVESKENEPGKYRLPNPTRDWFISESDSENTRRTKRPGKNDLQRRR